ncbi:unnamed protein product [Cylicocyclus nassatus]|uniref:Uncharacterized protein n=1 Tax=Cylicocyclus nassatus TaxID=53992 RepID=A0AA36HC82_CYLNA|nr:unnamed protein product [Cylicocyclus nassatus]
MKLLLASLLLDIAVVTCYEYSFEDIWTKDICPDFLRKSPNAKIAIEKIMEECKKGRRSKRVRLSKRLKRICQPKILEWIKEKKVSASQTWEQACPRRYLA